MLATAATASGLPPSLPWNRGREGVGGRVRAEGHP